MQEEYSLSSTQPLDIQSLGGAFLGVESDIYNKAAKQMKSQKIKKTGIYKIVNPIGQTYIGSSIDIDYRWTQYKKVQKTQMKISSSISHYGYDNHDFDVLTECDADLLNDFEFSYKQEFVDEKGWENALFYFLDDKSGNNAQKRKPVFQYDYDGFFVEKFKGVRDAARKTGLEYSTIGMCAAGKRKTASGFQWRYDKQEKISAIKPQAGRKETLLVFNNEGDLLYEFASTTKAADFLKLDRSSIAKVARGKRKTAGGFKYSYK
tara:strand:- start:147 stop:935 length:789 start_codon:yes stop_codon:yes gene_type:complete